MAENLFTLLMLVFLQAVLGFDNLLYISLESKRVDESKQKMVRMWGIGLAIVLRIVLLVVILKAIKSFQATILEFHTHALSVNLTIHALIVLGGGLFIVYTAVKEITHMLAHDNLSHSIGDEDNKKSPAVAIATIIFMNLVFSFDSILSAIALTEVVWVMAVAIIISGIGMIALSNTVSEFLKKNRMFEVLGLFILLIVGIMLLSEGGHLAHLSFFGNKVEAMSKTTFYFSIGIVVIVDIAQGKFQKKLDKERDHQLSINQDGEEKAET